MVFCTNKERLWFRKLFAKQTRGRGIPVEISFDSGQESVILMEFCVYGLDQIRAPPSGRTKSQFKHRLNFMTSHLTREARPSHPYLYRVKFFIERLPTYPVPVLPETSFLPCSHHYLGSYCPRIVTLTNNSIFSILEIQRLQRIVYYYNSIIS